MALLWAQKPIIEGLEVARWQPAPMQQNQIALLVAIDKPLCQIMEQGRGVGPAWGREAGGATP